MKPPGFDTDLVVSADRGAFYCVWLGRLLKWSPMAEHVRAAVDADRASMAR